VIVAGNLVCEASTLGLRAAVFQNCVATRIPFLKSPPLTTWLRRTKTSIEERGHDILENKSFPTISFENDFVIVCGSQRSGIVLNGVIQPSSKVVIVSRSGWRDSGGLGPLMRIKVTDEFNPIIGEHLLPDVEKFGGR